MAMALCDNALGEACALFADAEAVAAVTLDAQIAEIASRNLHGAADQRFLLHFPLHFKERDAQAPPA